jgi:hypothetical protein
LDPLAQGAKFAIKHSLLVAIAKVRAARATLEYLVSEYAARTLKLLKARRSPSSDAMDP